MHDRIDKRRKEETMGSSSGLEQSLDDYVITLKSIFPEKVRYTQARRTIPLSISLCVCVCVFLSCIYPKQVQSPPSWHYPPVSASSSKHVCTPHFVRHTVPVPPRTNYGPNSYHISIPWPVDGHVNHRVCQVQSCDRRVCARPWRGRRWF